MKPKQKLWAIGAGILALFIASSASASAGGSMAALSYLGADNLPLGWSRNNPGNIVRGVNYKGEVYDDFSRFAKFESWAYGIRAMIVLLRKYITTGSSYPNQCVTTPQNTVRLIVTQWAPPRSCGGDNDDAVVEKYIQFVSAKTGFQANAKLSADKNTLRKIVQAMSWYEQGRECVTLAQFNYAYENLI